MLDSPAGAARWTSLQRSPSVHLAPTYETFLRLHNSVAMPLMRKTEDLGKAFQIFEEANAVHVRIHGAPCAVALYNQGCCLSLAAGAGLSTGAEVAPGLPPLRPAGTSPKDVGEERLDLAAIKLDAALAAGYCDSANMSCDSDLSALREGRHVWFRVALERVNAAARSKGLPSMGAFKDISV